VAPLWNFSQVHVTQLTHTELNKNTAYQCSQYNNGCANKENRNNAKYYSNITFFAKDIRYKLSTLFINRMT